MWFCFSAGCLCGYGRERGFVVLVVVVCWFMERMEDMYLIAAQKSTKKSKFLRCPLGKNPTGGDASWFVRVNARLFFFFCRQK